MITSQYFSRESTLAWSVRCSYRISCASSSLVAALMSVIMSWEITCSRFSLCRPSRALITVKNSVSYFLRISVTRNGAASSNGRNETHKVTDHSPVQLTWLGVMQWRKFSAVNVLHLSRITALLMNETHERITTINLVQGLIDLTCVRVTWHDQLVLRLD